MAPLESDRLLSATEISAHPVSPAGDSYLSGIRDDVTDDEDLEAGDVAAESSNSAENLEMSLAEKPSAISVLSSYLTTRNQEIDEAPLLFRGDGEMSSAAASPHLTISTQIAPVDTPQTSGISPQHFRSRSLESPGSPAIFSPNHSSTLCRICLEHEDEDLIAPCLCKGSQKYVHRSCLDRWRNAKEGFAFSHCTECRTAFRIRENVPEDRWWRQAQFRALVVRDHVILFLFIQFLVAVVATAVTMQYGEELRQLLGMDEEPLSFSIFVGVFSMCLGVLYGSFVAIICGEQIAERHQGVLQRQELTKEFIVEDLDEIGRLRGEGQVNLPQPTNVREDEVG